MRTRFSLLGFLALPLSVLGGISLCWCPYGVGAQNGGAASMGVAAQAAGAAAVAPGTASPASIPAGFVPLDLPDWVILHTPSPTKDAPWILVVDDPQCPYCMQLLLALEKEREAGDPEISRAVLATLPYPLPYHDQSAHIVADAFCLEASRATRPWSAAGYLDWLIVEPWKTEPSWNTTTIDDLGKDGGFFDANYESHKVQSSRRRDYQTGFAKAESACASGGCRGDAECEKLCADQQSCRAACLAADPGAAARGGKCVAGCASAFVSKRYRQYSKAHSACLLEEGPGSVHAKVAAAFSWASGHKIPGTPTVYAGHPSIGFRELGDSDHLADALVLLRRSLAESRLKLKASTGAEKLIDASKKPGGN